MEAKIEYIIVPKDDQNIRKSDFSSIKNLGYAFVSFSSPHSLDKNKLQQNRWLKRYVITDAFLLSHTVKRNATD